MPPYSAGITFTCGSNSIYYNYTNFNTSFSKIDNNQTFLTFIPQNGITGIQELGNSINNDGSENLQFIINNPGIQNLDFYLKPACSVDINSKDILKTAFDDVETCCHFASLEPGRSNISINGFRPNGVTISTFKPNHIHIHGPRLDESNLLYISDPDGLIISEFKPNDSNISELKSNNFNLNKEEPYTNHPIKIQMEKDNLYTTDYLSATQIHSINEIQF